MALNRRAESRNPDEREGEGEKVSGEPERVAPQRDEVGERRQHEEFMRKWKEAKPASEH
jgi:hypothetical protein